MDLRGSQQVDPVPFDPFQSPSPAKASTFGHDLDDIFGSISFGYVSVPQSLSHTKPTDDTFTSVTGNTRAALDNNLSALSLDPCEPKSEEEVDASSEPAIPEISEVAAPQLSPEPTADVGDLSAGPPKLQSEGASLCLGSFSERSPIFESFSEPLKSDPIVVDELNPSSPALGSIPETDETALSSADTPASNAAGESASNAAEPIPANEAPGPSSLPDSIPDESEFNLFTESSAEPGPPIGESSATPTAPVFDPFSAPFNPFTTATDGQSPAPAEAAPVPEPPIVRPAHFSSILESYVIPPEELPPAENSELPSVAPLPPFHVTVAAKVLAQFVFC